MVGWFEDFRYRIWSPLPSWAKWTIVIWLILSFDAVRMAWGERRFVGGYFEALVADFVFAGIPILAFAFGISAGIKVYERTNSRAMGWVVGIATMFAVYSIRVAFEQIPGVGWRIERMQEAHDLAEELDE